MSAEATVVVGVSESLSGLQALRLGVAEARRRGCALRAVRAWQFGGARAYDDLACRQTWVAAAEALIRRAFDSAMGGLPADVATTLTIAEGVPGQVLLALVRHPDDVLVLGASRSWWRPGSAVTRHCLRRAGCPVIIVPPPSLAGTRRPRALARQLQRDLRRDALIADAERARQGS